MNKVVLPSWVQFNQESHFDDIAWLGAYREKERQAFLQNGFPTQKNERRCSKKENEA